MTLISRYQLQPGHWIQFFQPQLDENDLQIQSEILKDTILPNEISKPFKVIIRDYQISDYGACILMDLEGKLLKYSPAPGVQLKEKRLPWKFQVLELEEVSEEMQRLYDQSVSHLKTLTESSNFEFGFDPHNEQNLLNQCQLIKKFKIIPKFIIGTKSCFDSEDLPNPCVSALCPSRKN